MFVFANTEPTDTITKKMVQTF